MDTYNQQKPKRISRSWDILLHNRLYDMSLPDFSNADTLSKFESFLSSKSYIDGYVYM